MKRILLAVALSAAVAIAVPRPAPAADQGYKADNTKMNKEEKKETAEQQTESKADRKVTQQIRKAIVKDKSLSQYAHNVKIITRNGMVTLKGPVRSEKEKEAVENAAAKVVGKEHVTSKLQVVPKSK